MIKENNSRDFESLLGFLCDCSGEKVHIQSFPFLYKQNDKSFISIFNENKVEDLLEYLLYELGTANYKFSEILFLDMKFFIIPFLDSFFRTRASTDFIDFIIPLY